MMNLGTDPKWARHLRRWEKAVRNKGFWPEKLDFSHLFPALPTISHLFPLNFFALETKMRKRTAGVLAGPVCAGIGLGDGVGCAA